MFQKSSLSRLAVLLSAVFLVVGMASISQAKVHALSGNARFQIGDGLPIPIHSDGKTIASFTAVPNGAVKPIVGAVVTQTSGADPVKMTIQPGQLSFAGIPNFLPLKANNPTVFQIQTNLSISWPGAGDNAPLGAAVFDAGGRTGHAVVTWCPGQAVPGSGHVACANASLGAPVVGRLRYVATSNQFGGPAVGALGGTADLEVVAQFVAGCPANNSCQFSALDISPAPTGAVGGPFGWNNPTTPTAQPVYSIMASGVGAGGTILPGAVGVTVNPTATTNGGTSFGGPWTTGQVKISQPFAIGAAEIFTISGMDGRVGGVGSISLVAGGVSDRNFTGPNANRGWLNLQIAANTPSMSWQGIAAFVGLLTLTGGYAMRKRL